MIRPGLIRPAHWLALIPECPRWTLLDPPYRDWRARDWTSLDWTHGIGHGRLQRLRHDPCFRITPENNPSCMRSKRMAAHEDMTNTSSSLMSNRDDCLKLVPALRPYLHQITGVVWAVSWRRDVRKGIFHDFLSPIQAIGTENVSFQKPASFGFWPVARSDCLGNLLLAVQPPAQFLGSVPADNSDLIFTTVVVRHMFSRSEEHTSELQSLRHLVC